MQTTTERPALVQDAAFSLDAFHRRGSLRRAVEAQIDQLIAFLDYIDGDPDLKPVADDEPSLGWTRCGALGDSNDLEIDEVAL